MLNLKNFISAQLGSYLAFGNKRPFAFTTMNGLFFGSLADVISQYIEYRLQNSQKIVIDGNIEEKASFFRNISFQRTLEFAAQRGLYANPTIYFTVVRVLPKFVPGNNLTKKQVIFKIMIMDGVQFPWQTMGMVYMLSRLKENHINSMKIIKEKMPGIILGGWIFWPIWNFANFRFVRKIYQPSIVIIGSLQFTTYLAYSINSKPKSKNQG